MSSEGLHSKYDGVVLTMGRFSLVDLSANNSSHINFLQSQESCV